MPNWLRGEPPERTSFSEHFDDLTFRHREFRKTPNPTPEQFAEYSCVTRSTSSDFYHKNYKFCHACGVDSDDLMSMAMVWVCNFLGLYARPSKQENIKLMHHYIRQRFSQYRKYLERRCLRSMATEWVGAPDTDVVDTAVPSDDDLKRMSLDDICEELPTLRTLHHTDLIGKLIVFANGTGVRGKRRKKIRAQIDAHVRGCEICRKAGVK